jgi:hypothetical protein
LQIATKASLLRLGQHLVWTLAIAYLYGYASLGQAKRSPYRNLDLASRR